MKTNREYYRTAQRRNAGALYLALICLCVFSQLAWPARRAAAECENCWEDGYTEMSWNESVTLLEDAFSSTGLQDFRKAEPEKKQELLHAIESAFAARFKYNKEELDTPALVRLEKKAHEENLENPETLRLLRDEIEKMYGRPPNRFMSGIWRITSAKISVVLGDYETALSATAEYRNILDELIPALYTNPRECHRGPLCAARDQCVKTEAALAMALGRYGEAAAVFDHLPLSQLDMKKSEKLSMQIAWAMALENSGDATHAREMLGTTRTEIIESVEAGERLRFSDDLPALIDSMADGADTGAFLDDRFKNVTGAASYESVDFPGFFTLASGLLCRETTGGERCETLIKVALTQLFSAFHGIR